MASFDLIVLGGGPAGYTGAIRAAQLGLNTAIIDKREVLGGTCLNIGCIPSKALLVSSEYVRFAQHQAERHGLTLSGISVDIAKMMKRKQTVVTQLTQGVEFLMKKNRITRIKGTGQVVAPGRLVVSKPEGASEEHTAPHIMLATGSVPIALPGITIDRDIVVTSDEAIAFPAVPNELLVIGGGAIGLELGSVWARLGARVTIIEFLPRIAAFVDPDVSQTLQRALEAEGIKIQTNSQVTGVTTNSGKAQVRVLGPDKKELNFTADKVLVAVGRQPYLEGAVAKDLGLQLTNRGRVAIDPQFRTNIDGLYAVGDIIDGPMLAHKAEEDAIACVEFLAGKPGHVNYDHVPNIIYTNPEVVTVGLGEENARARQIAIKVGKFPFAANGRALANDQSTGFVKIIAEAKSDKLLGAQIIGGNASELIPEVVTVLEFGGSAEDIGRTVHGHPTLSEAVKEAALAVDNHAFSIAPR